MILKQGDIVKPNNAINKLEAVVDLVIGADVYITPRGKMSLSYPERYIINKRNLIKCDKESKKYLLTLEQIKRDWYEVTGEIIDTFKSKTINELTPGETFCFDSTIYRFIEYVDGKAVFFVDGEPYEMTQKDLDSIQYNLNNVAYNLYGIDNFEIVDEENENDKEQLQPKEVALL